MLAGVGVDVAGGDVVGVVVAGAGVDVADAGGAGFGVALGGAAAHGTGDDTHFTTGDGCLAGGGLCATTGAPDLSKNIVWGVGVITGPAEGLKRGVASGTNTGWATDDGAGIDFAVNFWCQSSQMGIMSTSSNSQSSHPVSAICSWANFGNKGCALMFLKSSSISSDVLRASSSMIAFSNSSCFLSSSVMDCILLARRRSAISSEVGPGIEGVGVARRNAAAFSCIPGFVSVGSSALAGVGTGLAKTSVLVVGFTTAGAFGKGTDAARIVPSDLVGGTDGEAAVELSGLAEGGGGGGGVTFTPPDLALGGVGMVAPPDLALGGVVTVAPPDLAAVGVSVLMYAWMIGRLDGAGALAFFGVSKLSNVSSRFTEGLGDGVDVAAAADAALLAAVNCIAHIALSSLSVPLLFIYSDLLDPLG